jgi:hypothetical protein
MEEPKGIKANLAILKCCNPKGIPTTVIQRNIPKTADSMARGIPVTSNHMIFNKKEPTPPPYSTSFPKGKKQSPANLKHCNPTGIPTMVMHQTTPASSQLIPLMKPPQINQIIFPRQPN